MPGCFESASLANVRVRARTYKVDFDDLAALVAMTNGRCMVCQACHASVADRGRSGDMLRGLVCKWCRTRLSLADGSTGNLGGEATGTCLCDPRTLEWRTRIAVATEQYLRRASRFGSPSVRLAFSQLVSEVREHGVDPEGSWIKDIDEIIRPVATTIPPKGKPGKRQTRPVPPDQREPCSADCTQHQEHVYVSCFDPPAKIADRDHHRLDPERDYPLRHYVGWTTQQPPGRRLDQHGRVCRESLALLVPGTELDERRLKALGSCPRCGEALWYFLAQNQLRAQGRA